MPEIVQLVERGSIQEVSCRELASLMAGYDRVLIDVGTGDAAYPYREARKDPSRLCVGIDPVAEAMVKRSNRIGRKPSRGGVKNLVLIVASVHTLPNVLDGVASHLTVFFPWSSLLRSLAAPDRRVLSRLRTLLRTGGRFEVLLNMQVFESEADRNRRGLPSLDCEYVERHLKPGWSAAGIEIDDSQLLAPEALPVRTTWGQSLALGSGRTTMYIRAHAGPLAAVELGERA